MEKRSLLPIVGIIIYIILTVIDKFMVNVSDIIYIIIGIISIILIIIGIFIDKKNKK